MKRTLLFLWILLCSTQLIAQDVVRQPASEVSLSQRWDWALQEGKQYRNGFWIGYAFERMLPENEYIGSFYFGDKPRISLREKITGLKPAYSESGRSSRPVLKEMAVLFQCGSSNKIEDIHMTDVNLWFPLKDRPLFWIGKAEAAESIALLSRIFDQSPPAGAREGVLLAVGAHKKPDLAIALLQKGLRDSSEDLRAAAAYWLALQDDSRAMTILKSWIIVETSEDAIEEAVAGVAESELPAARQMLVEWTDPAVPKKIRIAALQHLAEIAAENVEALLSHVVFEDDDTEVQEHALYALADMEDNQGLPEVIRVSQSHSNPEVRKAAIYLLGDSEDPRARKALIQIATASGPKGR